MRRSVFAVVISLFVACVAVGQSADTTSVDIVVSLDASDAVRMVADELARGLVRIYSDVRIAVLPVGLGRADHVVYFGRAESFPELRRHVDQEKLSKPESYVVTTTRIDGATVGIVLGRDMRGAVYAAYNLLERLGCGFYLSYDAYPSEQRREFSFDCWELSDAPLVRDRIVFNWHNFLSGCSTWNLPDWERWITQSQKMGYNGVMVHAYGNNPMVKFSFNGVDKPVGYLSTTRKGRDWSTQHVNDVRRLWGGFVFDGPVFGCEAAMAPDAERADAARGMMHKVFAHADRRDMDVYFAVDVDTASANPQEVIETLSQDARFPIAVEEMRWMNQRRSKIWLANPDTPQGYLYYKAQVDALMEAYPQIDCLVVWFRHNNTPWMAFEAAEMPQAWRQEYADEIEKTPDAAELWRSHNFFALGKIVTAFERALREIGRDDVRIAVGSWKFDFLPGCDRFLPRHVELIPLDWEVLHDQSQMRDEESRRVIRNVGTHRPVLPVVWAHHDDGNYVGRPYTPYSDFHSRLVDSRACGFGIIHWTTRPLDLYFKSLARQVWRATENQPLGVTCREMADRSFGPDASGAMAEYLQLWVTEAPKIGRDTSDYFIDRKLADSADIVPGYEDRMKLIDHALKESKAPAQRDRLDYFKGLERYITDVHLTEEAFGRSQELYKAGDLAAARRVMASCRPEEVIERYARTSSLGGITRGEQGMVASMNLRWLTHYVRYRQMLGTEPVRYNFAPTSHDPLAQSMGTFTFHFGPDREVWECLGTKETGASVFVVPESVGVLRAGNAPVSYEEICRSGIASDKPVTLTIRPIMAKGGRGGANAAKLPAGEYTLELLMLDPESTGPGQRVFDVKISKTSGSEWLLFDPVKAKYLRLVCHGNSQNSWNSISEVKIESLAKDGPEPIVRASGAVQNYPPANTIDGSADTRWAVFEMLVSDDGRQWSKVSQTQGEAARIHTGRTDIFKQTSLANKVLVCRYPVTVEKPDCIEITLNPVKGRVLLCGAILKPAGEGP